MTSKNEYPSEIRGYNYCIRATSTNRDMRYYLGIHKQEILNTDIQTNSLSTTGNPENSARPFLACGAPRSGLHGNRDGINVFVAIGVG